MASFNVRNCFKDAVGWIFMVGVVIAFILLVIMNAISPNRFASVEKNDRIDTILDTRCICICPHNLNLTLHHNKTVFIKETTDPGLCTCHHVIQDANELECLQCDCNYESRNALLIASIVYGTLVLSFCCMPPCACVVCIQPWIRIKALRTYSGPSVHNSSTSPSSFTRIKYSSHSSRARVGETHT